MAEQTPVGVVGILFWPDGSPLCSVSDFDRSGYGGFSRQQTQRVRVQKAPSKEALRQLCNPIVPRSLDSYDCEQIVEKMIAKNGFRIEYVNIGEDVK